MTVGTVRATGGSSFFSAVKTMIIGLTTVACSILKCSPTCAGDMVGRRRSGERTAVRCAMVGIFNSILFERWGNMCRWMAYLGDSITVDELVFRPVHSIIDQSLHAKLTGVTTNGDGFGIGWECRGPGP